MKQSEIYKHTADRLKRCNVFSEATIKTVASFADKQSKYTSYKDFFNAMNIPKPTLFTMKKSGGVAVVDILAKNKQKGTIVLHLPMANPLDENQLYHIATVVGTNPSYRVIAFGNPSGKPYNYREQNLNLWQKFAVAFTNNLRPLVCAELEYIKSQGIEETHHVGYSYGAHKAMIEAYYSNPATVKSLTLIDPVAHTRGFRQLVHDFKNTLQPMGEYVNRTHIQTYFDARKAAADKRHYDHALTRPINIAIGLLLRRVDFITMLEKVFRQQPGMLATVAWGSQSELTNDAHMKVSMHRLKYEEKKNIRAIRIETGKHALANDIHLYAAFILDIPSR